MNAKEMYDYYNKANNAIPLQLAVTGITKHTLLQILAVLVLLDNNSQSGGTE